MTAPAVSTYPTAIDTWTLPKADDTLASPEVEHDLIHDSALDAIRKIEIELGIAASPDIGSVDYKLSHHTHQGNDGSAKFASIPIQMVSSQVPNPLEVKNSLGSVLSAITPAGEFLDIGATAGTYAYRSYVVGDTNDRWRVQANGSMGWGPGTTAPDVTLSRSGVGALSVSGSLSLGAPLPVSSGGTGSSTQNWVDLVTAQTIGGGKVFSALITASAGIEVDGSPSGYVAGEVKFAGNAPTNTGFSVSADQTSGYFDHRRSGNAGDWVWRNAANASTVRMRLSGTGELMLGTSAAAGGTYMFNVVGPAGTNPPVYLRSTAGSSGDGNYQINISHTGDPIGGWLIGHEGTSNGKFKLAWEAGGGPADRLTLDTNGNMTLPNAGAAVNVFSTGGYNGVVLSGTNRRVETRGDQSGLAGFDAANNARYLVGIRSDITGTTSDFVIYTYSPGRIFFYSGAQLMWGMDNSGNLMSTGGSGGSFPNFTGNGVIALRNASANPFTTPVAGGVLYSSGGALHWRGSSGTDTIIANA